MEDLKAEIYSWCDEEHHVDIQIAEEEDFSKPHIWLRFLHDPMDFNKWHAIELRHLEEQIDSDKVQHFVNTLPQGQTIVNKIMISKKGATQAATVLAGQHGVRMVTFAQNPPSTYYGYLEPVVKSQTIDTPKILSQREWQRIHQCLEESKTINSTIKALIVDPQSEQKYTWNSLELALPIVTPYETVAQYVYDFPKHHLQITGEETLLIERITFKYTTSFRTLDAREEIEALAEVLEKIVMD